MTNMSRRGFIEGVVAASTALVAAPWHRAWGAGKPPDIVDVHGQDPGKMIQAALEGLGGIKRFVHKGDYVVIKPNAGFANPPSWGTTTHPDTVLAMARACLDAGAKRVTVVEYPVAKGKDCLRRCGITAALEKVPQVAATLLAGSKDFRKVKIRGGVATDSVAVAKLVLSADVLINLPAAKAHTATGVSLGMKNAMGLIHDRKAFHTLFDLHQGIADLARVVKPQLTVVDATRALLTNGPAGPGETATPNRMIAGTNVVTVDAYALGVARFNLKTTSLADVRHINLAVKAGLGKADASKVRVQKVRV